MYRVSPFVRHFAAAPWLPASALATLWVNLAPASYYDFDRMAADRSALAALACARRRSA